LRPKVCLRPKVFPAPIAFRVLPPTYYASGCQREVVAELRKPSGQMMVSRHHCD
jgi:hypothetical protein